MWCPDTGERLVLFEALTPRAHHACPNFDIVLVGIRCEEERFGAAVEGQLKRVLYIPVHQHREHEERPPLQLDGIDRHDLVALVPARDEVPPGDQMRRRELDAVQRTAKDDPDQRAGK